MITSMDNIVISNNSCMLLLIIDKNKGHAEFFLLIFFGKFGLFSSLLKYSLYIV